MSTATPAWWRVRLRSPVIRMGLGAIVFVLVGLSLNGNPYYLGLYTVGVLTYILAVSLNLLLGYAGLFALAQQALYGVGAYAIVIVGTRVGSLPWIVCLLVAVAVAAIAGLLLALPTARLRGDYLALATLAFAVGFQQLVSNWISVTGGSSGLVDVPTAHLFGHDIEPQTNAFLWLVGVAAAIAFLWSSYLVRSRIGRCLHALRDSTLATESVGVNPTVIRGFAFAVSGALAGLAGGLFAAYQLVVVPTQYGFSLLVLIILAVLIGGMGTDGGPLVGAVFVTVLQRFTTSLQPATATVVYAAILLVVMLSFRGGALGVTQSLWQRLRPREPAPATRPDRRPPEPSSHATPRPDGPVVDRLAMSDVDVVFGGVHALTGVSLSVRRGEVVGLIGPNGAGKTTAVNAMTGVVRPVRGDVEIGDSSIRGRRPYRVSRMGVGRTYQHPQLSPGLSVLENVMLGFDRWARATLVEASVHSPRSRDDERRFRAASVQLLARVGAAEFADRLAGAVPYAVQRKVELARVLAGRPAFVLLDEPAAGLNDAERQELGEVISSIAADDGPGVLVIEHNMDLVRQACARVVVLVNGSVLLSGPTDHVLRDPRVAEVYLGAHAEVVREEAEVANG
jgi:ABC-type branched-subunit amino acid transport system ATPase component/ABC-type branched-subunit amino acid transport system permease subunit